MLEKIHLTGYTTNYSPHTFLPRDRSHFRGSKALLWPPELVVHPPSDGEIWAEETHCAGRRRRPRIALYPLSLALPLPAGDPRRELANLFTAEQTSSPPSAPGRPLPARTDGSATHSASAMAEERSWERGRRRGACLETALVHPPTLLGRVTRLPRATAAAATSLN